MLTVKPANPEQYDEFLQLMRESAADYLERTMELMQMSWDEFARLFRTVGQVYGVYDDERLAGFCWIEPRERILHLHGLILQTPFQGKGIGTRILEMLETEYAGQVDALELGVHASNARAKALYERVGFETVKTMEDLGFFVMQKRLSAERRTGETR
jgi:ribosomal protein S18 acetylase RimI-like enzyme